MCQQNRQLKNLSYLIFQDDDGTDNGERTDRRTDRRHLSAALPLGGSAVN